MAKKGYTTKEKVEKYTGLTLTDADVDDYIEAVEVYIDRFTNRPFNLGSAEDVPADLSFAATVLVSGIISSTKEGETGEVQSMSVGRYSVTFRSDSQGAKDLPKAMDIVKGYKRFSF